MEKINEMTEKNRMTVKNRKAVIIGVTVILSLLAIGGFSAINEKFSSNSDLTFIGTMEAKEIDVRNKIPGEIMEMYVSEGMELKEGDVLYKIDPRDLQVKKLQAEAAVKAAEAQLEKALNGARKQDLQSAKALADKAAAKADLLEKKHERYLAVFEAGGLSRDKLDEFETELFAAQSDQLAAEEQYKMALEGARAEDILALEAQHEGALAKLEEVQVYLDDAEVKAPIAGTVSLMICNQGELIGTGTPVVTITDYHDSWVEINIEESVLGKIGVGQEALVKSKAYDEKTFSGEVVSINKNPDFAIKKSTNELNDQDLITYAVKIKITDQEKILYPGMLVEVSLNEAGE